MIIGIFNSRLSVRYGITRKIIGSKVEEKVSEFVERCHHEETRCILPGKDPRGGQQERGLTKAGAMTRMIGTEAPKPSSRTSTRRGRHRSR